MRQRLKPLDLISIGTPEAVPYNTYLKRSLSQIIVDTPRAPMRRIN
jgi:hypothetical protein